MTGTGEDRPAEDVLTLLDDVCSAARDADRPGLADRLVEARARLTRPARHVVVVGEFKKGKSSLVNGLLNARVCVTDADIATAVPAYVGYGEEYALSEGTGDGGADEVTIRRGLLRDGLVLVDTPGLGGGLASGHASAALNALSSSASVALIVSDASQEYSAAELEFVAAVAAECPDVVCVITKIDLYPQWREIVAADRAHLDRIGVRADILPVSALLRRAGLAELDRDLLVESGFPRLALRLIEATQHRTRPSTTAAAAAARSVVAQLLAELGARRAVLAGSVSPADAAQAWQEQERRAAALQGANSRWQQVLADQMGDLQAEVDADVVQRLRALRKEAVAKIAELPASRVVVDLGPWLQRRTNEELLDHVQRVRAEADRVADAVSEQFGDAARSLRAAVAVTVDRGLSDAAVDVRFDAARVQNVGAFEPGVSAMRVGATGAVVTHAAGLVLSVAVPVLLPVSIALSAALGGKAWRSARTHQQRVLRMELERAVIAYLDDVDVSVRRDSRSAVRRIQRQLREGFTARAGELHETFRRTARQLREDAAAAEQTRNAELAAIVRDIEQLRQLHARCSAAVAAGLQNAERP